MILFHQFFDQTSSTLTYLLADPLSGDAVIIDSVKEHLGAYLTFLQEQELQLAWCWKPTSMPTTSPAPPACAK